MTKRKAQALVAQQTPTSTSTTGTLPNNTGMLTSTFSPMAPITGTFSSVTSASQLVDLGAFEDPTFDYSSNNDLASFTLDTFEPGQLDLFANLLNNHNADFANPPASARMPAAVTALPTALNNAMADGNAGASLVNPDMTANDLAMAETDLSNFESSLEDLLSRELENMEQDGGRAVAAADQAAFQYNDFESQRFTEFLEQMPEHMWGMEFVN
jgi:hypothetical protein